MVSRRTDRLFHKMTHHTNISQPFSKYLSGLKYPMQPGTELGRPVTLKYRNKYIPNISYISESSPDKQQFDPTPYEDKTFVGDIIEQEFILLRCDMTEPYIMIAITDDYTAMIVGDSRDYKNTVYEYPKQIEEYLGLAVINQYFGSPNTLNAVVLSCDSMEPCQSIIAEFYAGYDPSGQEYRTDYVRFVLESEVQSVVMDRYDADGLRDYNGKDVEGNIGLLYIDLDGFKPDYGTETMSVDANGGYPNPLQDMYRTGILSREEVLELRGRILTEKRIYGCEYIYPESITLDQTQLYIVPRQGVQLTATVLPEGAIGRVFWKSSDSNIVRVSNSGFVVGRVIGGSATITATTEFGGKKAECEVMVVIAVTGIDFDYIGEIIDLKQDETFKIIAKAIPDNATVPDLTYTSDNEWIEIDENHIVKLKEGYELDEGYEATITIASVSNPEVSVSFGINYLPTIVHPTNVILSTEFMGPYHDNISNNDFYFFVPSGNNYNPETYLNPISYKIEPETVTETRLHWKVTDPQGYTTSSAVIVDTPVDEIGPYTEGKDGTLPGLEIDRCQNTGRGTRYISKIIATGDRGVTDNIFVARGNPITNINWVKPSRPIKGLDTGTFRVKVDRLNNAYPCSEYGITFTSSDPSILKLNDYEIHYKDNYPNYFTVSYEAVNLGGGHVTVTAKTVEDYFGSFTATMELDIVSGYIPVQAIEFKQPGDASIWTNKDGQEFAILEVRFIPSNATYKNVDFDVYFPYEVGYEPIGLTIIDETTCRVDAYFYDFDLHPIIIATSTDNPSATAQKVVSVNTECKGIEIEGYSPDVEEDNKYLTINLLSDGHGAVNNEFVDQVIDSMKVNTSYCFQNPITFTAEPNHYYEISSINVDINNNDGYTDNPAIAKFLVYDEYNHTWKELDLQFGKFIEEIQDQGTDVYDPESYLPGDLVEVRFYVDPYYWTKWNNGITIIDDIEVVDIPRYTSIDEIIKDDIGDINFVVKLKIDSKVIMRGDRVTIRSTKNNSIIGTYIFEEQVGRIPIEEITPSVDEIINTYHKTYYLKYQLQPTEYYDTIPNVFWYLDGSEDSITFSENYEEYIPEIYTNQASGLIPITVISDRAKIVTINYESIDINGSYEVIVGKKITEYQLSVLESDYVEYDEANNTIDVKGPAMLSIEAHTEDEEVLNGLIDFVYYLPSFVEVFEYHDDITYKPTSNFLELNFFNINTIGTTDIQILPQDGLDVEKILTINYGNAITNMQLDPNDLMVDRTVVTEKDGVYYIDLIAGSNQANIPIKVKANIDTTYPGFAPTIWDTIWSVTGNQFEQYTDDINLNNEGSDYYIENDGIRYKNTNKEATETTISVRTADDVFSDSIKISTMGIKIKENTPITYVDGEYVYDDLLAANVPINLNNLFDFVPSEDYISIQNMQVTSDLAAMVDYTLDHGIFKITHVKSYDYDDSKPIGINFIARSYLIPDQEVTMFIRLKLVDMNYMVNFGYKNNSYTEEMYTTSYNPDTTNNYYSNNIKLTMEGQDKLAIPDDYKITDVNFSTGDPAITVFSSYDNNPIDYKDYKISYKLNKPGLTTIGAKTSDNVYNSTASLNIHGVMFTQRTLETYTETTYELGSLIINNGVASYGVVVYDIDSTLSDPDVATIDHYTGEISMNEITGNVYVKAYYENYPKLYDYIKIQVEEAPVSQCVDIDIVSSVASEINEIIIKDDTDLRTITFKQKDINDQYLKADIQLHDVSITNVGTAIDYENHPGTRPANYQNISISTETPLLHTGIGTLTAVSWDQNVTKTLPVKYGNAIISAAFPSDYSNFKINLANEPSLKKFRLKVNPEYPGYKPSSTCTWSSSNPSVLSVDPNGTMEKDSLDGNRYNFFTTYTLHAPLIGNVTITADTSYGSYSFNIIVYDSAAPVERDMLNIHEIDMVYTNDLLEHQLSVINPPTEASTTSWDSERISVATVSDSGLVTIIDVPAENEFTYYDDHGNPLEEVSLDFYINVTVQTEMVKYVDKCLVHIVGESKSVPTAKLIHVDEMIVKTGTENVMEFIGTPYYIKNNNSNNTITFTNLNYDITPDPFTLNNFNYPAIFDDDGIARVSFNVGDYNFIKNIIDEEYDYEELPNKVLAGDYDFEDIDHQPYNPEPYVVDVDFEEVPAPGSEADDGHFEFGCIDESTPVPPPQLDFDFDGSDIPDGITEGYDFETINYDPDNIGPKDTPYDADILTRKYKAHLNNPKNVYGAGVVDSTFDIYINMEGSVDPDPDPDPDPQPDPDPYDPSIYDNPLAEFFITTTANYDEYSDTFSPLNDGQVLTGYYGKDTDYYDPEFMYYFGNGSSVGDDEIILAIIGQDPYTQCDEYDLINDESCVTFTSNNNSVIEYPENGEYPQGWNNYFYTFYCKKGLGNAKVIIRTSDARHYYTADVRVLGIKFTQDEITINIGDTIDIRDYIESNGFSTSSATFDNYSDEYEDFDTNNISLYGTIVTGVSSGRACIRMTYETTSQPLYNFLIININ